MAKIKRALCLAGGGPAVGLSIGMLKRLEQEPEIDFDVWSTACIGAWLGVVYNQFDGADRAEQSLEFFKHKIFRADRIYDRFPIAKPFAPDFISATNNLITYMMSPASYRNLVVPEAIMEAAEYTREFLSNPRQWNIANFNAWVLNGFMVANPFSRFMVGSIYQTQTRGLSRIFYPDSAFLKEIDFDRLYDADRPVILHNAYNLTQKRLDLFTNRPLDLNLPKLTAQTLCACSALPYIEEPVKIGSDLYCEGATVDTVNFKDLLTKFPDLEEVWVSRILDIKQIRRPENLYDALNNLVMLFAATTSEDDVKLFKHKVERDKRDIKIIEIPVASNINYDWTWDNLERSVEDGFAATNEVLKSYKPSQRPGRKPTEKNEKQASGGARMVQAAD